MTFEIPDGMPQVRRGAHDSPKDGACIMEYAGYLAGEQWTDRPACVDHDLAILSRNVNDTMQSDEGRAKLLDLLPRLMATGGLIGRRFPLPRERFDHVLRRRVRQMIALGLLHAANPVLAQSVSGYEVPPTLATDDDRYKLLKTAIDVWEELYGRRTPVKVEATKVAELSALVSA